MNYTVFEQFCDLNKIKYRKNEQMCKHTSFKIGGPADIFVEPSGEEELILILKVIREENIPFLVIGKGSNLLVSDKGIEGAVISLAALDEISVSGNKITVKAGASLAAVCVKAMQNNL